MTDPQLQKHKKHCDMWNCETCKTPSSDEREQLARELMQVNDGGTLGMKFDLYALVDFILSRDQSTRTQVLEEVERDVIGDDTDRKYDTWSSQRVNRERDIAERAEIALRAEQRALIQQKKGKA